MSVRISILALMTVVMMKVKVVSLIHTTVAMQSLSDLTKSRVEPLLILMDDFKLVDSVEAVYSSVLPKLSYLSIIRLKRTILALWSKHARIAVPYIG